MGITRVDAVAVLALAERVLEAADELDEIHWPAIGSDQLPGSAVGRAVESPVAMDRLADVVAHLRSWAAAAQSSAAELGRAEGRHANRIGEPG